MSGAEPVFPEALATARLHLRPVQLEDAPALFAAYAQDAEVARHLTWRPHTNVEETRRFVAASQAREDAQTYVLALAPRGEAVGVLDLRRTGPARLEAGYALARPFWSRGLMTEALAAAADWALAQPAIWRLGAVADVENRASMRVMEKAGLRREGVLRRWLLHPNLSDAPRDCVSYARTR